MPFTPYHFGPVLLLGVLLVPFVDFATLMMASVILDLEPIAVLYFGLPYQVHGFFHTYLGASIMAMVLSGFVYPFRKYLNDVVSLFGLHQRSSLRHIIGASFVGTFSHVFLDSLLYPEMNPFYPVLGNPFVGLFSLEAVYSFCVFAGLVGFGFYVLRVLLKPRAIAIGEDPFT
jgi:membrane-bound metal-dependent hydrolase YbcI (DUF457 family)